MIYLYAITEAAAGMPDCCGFDEAPLQLVEADGVGGAYSTHSRLEGRPEPEMLWRHELVVEQLMRRGAILPARFGTTFPDVEALAGALSRAAPRLLPQLERVRGCVELAVRVRSPSTAASPPHGGGDYLKAKLMRRREHESAAQRTLVPLGRLAAESRRQERARDGGVISASYLVRETDVSRFTDEVRLLQQENEELLLSCTGPWAPYSFVGNGSA